MPTGISASERLPRLFARFIAAGYLFELVATGPSIADAARHAAWLTAITAIPTFASGLALGIASLARNYARAISYSAWSAGLTYIASLSLWLCVNAASPIELDGQLFLYFFSVLPTMAVALPLPTWASLLYGTVAIGGSVVANALIGAGRDPIIPSLAFSYTFGATFVAASLVAWRVGDRLDRAHSDAVEAAAATAAIQGREAEQRAFAALVHDDVIATILAATRVDDSAVVAQVASDVLTTLDGYGREQFDSDLSPASATAALAAVVLETAPKANFVAEPSVDTGTISSSVTEALIRATTEALRNVLRHAGTGGICAVRATFGPRQVEIVISDDGAGFEPDRVAPDRLGLTDGIVARMTELQGGAAQITSAPGAGTVITLRWVCADE